MAPPGKVPPLGAGADGSASPPDAPITGDLQGSIRQGPAPEELARVVDPATIGNRRARALAQVLGGGRPPDDLIPPLPDLPHEPGKLPPGAEMPSYAKQPARWSREAASVAQRFGVMMRDGASELTGVGESSGALRLRGPGDYILRSSHVPDLIIPDTLAEGRRMRREANPEWFERQREYFDRIQRDLPPEALEVFNRIYPEVAALYRDQDPAMEAWLQAVAQVGGFPDTAPLNDATGALLALVETEPFLLTQGVGGEELQILDNDRLARSRSDWTQQEEAFLRQGRLRSESIHVRDLFSHASTRMRREVERPRRDWIAVEDYGRAGYEAYERLAGERGLRSTDRGVRERVGLIGFPQSNFDWSDPNAASAAAALETMDREWESFGEASRRYSLGTASANMDLMKAADAATLERSPLDTEFQVARLEGELARVVKYVKGYRAANNGAMPYAEGARARTYDQFEDDVARMHRIIDGYTHNARRSDDYARAFASGDNVLARAHADNAGAKDAAMLLVVFGQFQLEDMNEWFNVRRADGTPQTPSVVSLDFSSDAYKFWESVRGSRGESGADFLNRIDTAGHDAWFFPLWTIARTVIEEFGLFGLASRHLPDTNFIDRAAARVGTQTTQEHPRGRVTYGAANKGFLLADQPPTPLAMTIAGAAAVYGETDFSSGQVWHHPKVGRAPHGGHGEFYLAVGGVHFTGTHQPPIMQGGAAAVWPLGDYGRVRSGVIERTEGSAGVLRIMREMAEQHRSSFFYPGGTRFIHSRGGDPFVDYQENPWAVVSPRRISDPATSGMGQKFMEIMRRLAGRVPIHVLMNSTSHTSNAAASPLAWYLGQDVVEAIRQYLSPYNTLHTHDPRAMDRVIHGLMLAAAGMPTVEEWQEHLPERFVHPDGMAFSPREVRMEAYRLGEAVFTAAQNFEVYLPDLHTTPDLLAAEHAIQRAALERMEALPEAGAITEAEVGFDRHLVARAGRLAYAQSYHEVLADSRLGPYDVTMARIIAGDLDAEIPERPSRRTPFTAFDDARIQELVERSGVSQQFADSLLTSDNGYTFRGTRTEQAEARRSMVGAMLTGAVLRKEGIRVGVDADKTTEDHVFELSRGGVRELVDGEMTWRLTGLPSDAEVTEHFRFFPEVVALFHGSTLVGDRVDMTDSPLVLFSATDPGRLHEIFRQADKVPLVRTLGRVVSRDPNFNASLAGNYFSPQALQTAHRDGFNPRHPVVSVVQLVDHQAQVLKLFAENGYSTSRLGAHPYFPEWATDDHVARSVGAFLGTHSSGVKNPGDHHFKDPLYADVTMVIDDRAANAALAAGYQGVTAFEPEPSFRSPVRQYLATGATTGGVTTDVNARLNEGRDGRMFDVLDMLTWPEARDRTTANVVPRGERSTKVRGLGDQPFSIHYGRHGVYERYELAAARAHRKAMEVRAATLEAAGKKARSHEIARESLAVIIESMDLGSLGIEEVRRFNAMALLRPLPNDKGKLPEIKVGEPIERLEWLVRRIPDEATRSRAEVAVETLRDRELIDLAADLQPRPPKKGLVADISRAVGTAKRLWGALTGAGSEAGISLQHVIASAIEPEVNARRLARRALTAPRDARLLYQLATVMRDGNDKVGMSPDHMARAYGVVAGILVKSYLEGTVEAALADESLPEATRRDLGQSFYGTHDHIDRRVAEVRQLATSLGRVALDGMESFNTGSDIVEGIRAMAEGPMGQMAIKMIRSELNDRIGVINDANGRMAQQRVTPDLSHLDHHTQGVYRALEVAYDVVGGHTTAGDIVAAAQAHLAEFGLDETIRLGGELKGRMLALMNNRQAPVVAANLGRAQPWEAIDALTDSPSQAAAMGLRYSSYAQATQAFLAGGHAIVAENQGNPARAQTQFRHMAFAAWALTSSESREATRALMHEVTPMIFVGDASDRLPLTMEVVDVMRQAATQVPELEGEREFWSSRIGAVAARLEPEFDPLEWATRQLGSRESALGLYGQALTSGLQSAVGQSLYMIRSADFASGDLVPWSLEQLEAVDRLTPSVRENNGGNVEEAVARLSGVRQVRTLDGEVRNIRMIGGGEREEARVESRRRRAGRTRGV